MHRPARTFVLPVPLSRMVAPYAAHRKKRSRTSAPRISYRLAVIMHRMWSDGTQFRWTRKELMPNQA
ncbi:MAG: hypothetical protein EOR49_35130 [Mesorhizobium sp.]|nr:MAG: hypothetical protein EOR49_35130 [Mesorhizobium sp.]